MKKVLSIIMMLVIALFFSNFGIVAKAATVEPEYDATFNNNKGIFYANGNDVEINKNAANQTVVSWEGGSQVITDTTTVVGGGKEGTSFEESDIVMNGGTVGVIYGGGASLNENSSADVKKSKVEINGGTVTATVYGGGLIYSKVNTSNVKINGGTVNAVCGGGCASAVISGGAYAAGTEAEPQNSKNRTETANVTINGGTIDSIPSNYGTVFGGGQGYSYVGTANLAVNEGDLSKAYVTAGGSNGYTGTANTKISGGNIMIYQTVNRGTIQTANIKIDGGQIETAYVGGENDASVNGTIGKVEFDVLDGNIEHLKKGTSGGTELNIDQNKYKVVSAEGTVTESLIGEKEIKIKYHVDIVEENVRVSKGASKQLTAKVTTEPAGYETLFLDEKQEWVSADENIVKVDSNGKIIGTSIGKSSVYVSVLEEIDSVEVNVMHNPTLILIIICGVVIVIMIIVILIEFLVCRGR